MHIFIYRIFCKLKLKLVGSCHLLAQYLKHQSIFSYKKECGNLGCCGCIKPLIHFSSYVIMGKQKARYHVQKMMNLFCLFSDIASTWIWLFSSLEWVPQQQLQSPLYIKLHRIQALEVRKEIPIFVCKESYDWLLKAGRQNKEDKKL